jgi:uncharacterized phage protein (TIGR02218 family)
MKIFGAAYATQIALGATTLAHALIVTRTDGDVFGFTSHHSTQTVRGVSCTGGLLDVTSLISSAQLSVDNLELTTLDDGSIFTRADLLGGVWRNAAFSLVRYNYNSPSDTGEDLMAGHFGQGSMRANAVVIELRDVKQYLQQDIGSVSSKTCRDRLGGPKCRKNLTAFTKTGALTSITSNQVFRDSGRAEAADYFGEGELTWLTGNNAGISAKVASYAANGTFTLALPMFSAVQVGDTYSAIAGCRKRREEDCRDKFDNVLNFYGEPDRQLLDDLTKSASAA